ncbi:hypothetical protein AMAG_02632 [Allomyces macrogynus ATCC 38327]|uniref:Alpha/beta hydrolase fold-3 domain-containing protein n=1 Tax=Allomyces macrogynus (strain ATCC 38327) TaxID=578462 RepID=A0A0L0S366_ALLM3|nr:hypothetical protein AMAG_02632 [Allomyces macrogynus ATCC 38327]|eukprot:KNE56860.1 hypothetical protein AMAG_02632 [Allomyces macrogynus ATCC 38327]
MNATDCDAGKSDAGEFDAGEFDAGDFDALFTPPPAWGSFPSFSEIVSALLATLVWFQTLFLSLYAALFITPRVLPTSTRRAAALTALGRSLCAVVPSHWIIRAATEVPLVMVGSILKRLPARFEDVAYQPITINVDPDNLGLDLSVLGIDYKDEPRAIYAEWVAKRDQLKEGSRTDVAFYIHGGAFCMYSPRTYRLVTRQLAKLGFTVLAPAYRKAPKHPFPCGLYDMLAAYLWLVRDEGVDPGRILLIGDSAGGSLALGVFQAITALDLQPPAAITLWSPCLTMDPRIEDSSLIKNAHKDYLSIITNPKLGLIRMYAGDHIVNAGMPAMENFLAHPFVQQTTAQPTCPVLIQSSPSEQLVTCITDFYENQDPFTSRVQHDLLVDTPHDPFLFGVVIKLTVGRDLSQVGRDRLWAWWRDVQDGAVPFGRIQRMWHSDGRIEVVENTTGCVDLVEDPTRWILVEDDATECVEAVDDAAECADVGDNLAEYAAGENLEDTAGRFEVVDGATECIEVEDDATECVHLASETAARVEVVDNPTTERVMQVVEEK